MRKIIMSLLAAVLLCIAPFRVDAKSHRQEFIGEARKMADTIIRDDNWKYSNQHNVMNWIDAGKAKKRVTNCALFPSHVLQQIGVLKKNQTFYFDRYGRLISRNGAYTQLRKYATFKKYRGVSISKVKLRPGDIVGYDQHMNIYLGMKNGKRQWLDLGRAGTQDEKANSGYFCRKIYFTSNTVRGHRVYMVIRMK